jgi:hypothetical protein
MESTIIRKKRYNKKVTAPEPHCDMIHSKDQYIYAYEDSTCMHILEL